MDDARSRYAQALDAFGRLVAGVRPGQWEAPTPCGDWSVRDLVAHLVDEQRWAPPLLAGQRVEDVDATWAGDPLGADPVGTWVSASGEAREAARTVGLTDTVHLSYGDVPAEHYLTEMTFDLVVHGWDLARGTGAPTDLDPGLVADVLEWAGPRLTQLGDTGLFAPPVPVRAEADPLARLVALTGRDPGS